MSGRVCPPQAVPFQARPFLPAQASATFSLELCLMSPSHQSSDNAWGALLGMDVSPWVALPNAHSKPPGPGGPWASRVPAQTEGSLEWEAAKLPGHPQPGSDASTISSLPRPLPGLASGHTPWRGLSPSAPSRLSPIIPRACCPGVWCCRPPSHHGGPLSHSRI